MSQGFLDSQRAMVLKWATKRGTYKEGGAVTDADKAGYAQWEADHPPKADAGKPGRPPKVPGVPRGEEASMPPPPAPGADTPKAKAPPRVDPDPPRERA